MKPDMTWICVADNPSRLEESVASDVVGSVDRAVSETRVEASDSARLEVHIPDAGVAREVYESFVSYRDNADSKREYRACDGLLDRFVGGLDESDLDVDL